MEAVVVGGSCSVVGVVAVAVVICDTRGSRKYQVIVIRRRK